MRKLVLFLILFASTFLLPISHVSAGDPNATPTPKITATATPPVKQVFQDSASSDPNKNPFEIRGIKKINDAALKLIQYDHEQDKKMPPNLRTLIEGNENPGFANAYAVYDWNNTTNKKGDLMQPTDKALKGKDYATAVGLNSKEGDVVKVPQSGYGFNGYQVVVLYASKDSISVKYTPADSVQSGYTLHLSNINVNPKILELYDKALEGGRTKLPALPGGYKLGTASGNELLLAIVDTGQFLDPRWELDWWRENKTPTVTPTSTLPVEAELVPVTGDENPFSYIGPGNPSGPLRNYAGEQTEEGCSNVEWVDPSNNPPLYTPVTGTPRPEARTNANLRFNNSSRGLHCGQAKGTPIELQEISQFKIDVGTLCADMRVRQDQSGKNNDKTGVWWAGEVGINYNDPEQNLHLPFVEELGDKFAGMWDAEHMSEKDIEDKEKILNNPSASTNPNDPAVALYLKTKAEKEQKTGALKALLPEGAIDTLKCGFVKYVNYKGALSRYSGFKIYGKPLSSLKCPPELIDDRRFAGFVYRGNRKDWETNYQKAWNLMPVVPNDHSTGELKFDVCEDREYFLWNGIPQVMRFGLATNELWKMKTPMGDPDTALIGTQEGFYKLGNEDLRDALESLLRRGKIVRNLNLPSPPAPELDSYDSRYACEAPRPENDTGLVFHGPLSGYSNNSKAGFDNVMRLARDLKGKWMVMYPGDTGQAAFAANEAKEFGMMPIIRPKVKIDDGFIDWKGYVAAAQGAGFQSPYIQIFNEPGDDREYNSKSPNLDLFADKWVKAAREIIAAGGRPGLQIQSREDLDTVLRHVSKDDLLWQKVWFSMHDYADNQAPPEQKAKAEDDKVFLSAERWGDVFMSRIGFVPPTLTTEGGWEEKPVEGCNDDDSRAGRGCKPTAAEKQRIAEYNKRAYIDTITTGILPNGKPLPDYMLGLNPAFILSNFGNDNEKFQAFAWDGGLFDWKPTMDVFRNSPKLERVLECEKKDRQQRQQQRQRLERLNNELYPYLNKDLQKFREQISLGANIFLKAFNHALEKTAYSDLKRESTNLAQNLLSWRQKIYFGVSAKISNFWRIPRMTDNVIGLLKELRPKMTTVFAQTLTDFNPFNDKKSTLLAQGGGQCFHIEMGITNKVVNSDGSIDFDLQSQLVFDGSKEGHIQLFVDGDSQTGKSQGRNIGTSIPFSGRRYDLSGYLLNNYARVHVPNGGTLNKTIFAKVDECHPQYLNENGTSCQFTNSGGDIKSNCAGQLPSIYQRTSSTDCSNKTQCCLNADCVASCSICNTTQIPPSDTIVWPDGGSNHVLLGVDWAQDDQGNSFIDPVRFRYKVPKYVPGQELPGCKFTAYEVTNQIIAEVRQENRQEKAENPLSTPRPLPQRGTISCGVGGSGGGCPGEAPYCGPGWVCGDFDCEAQHHRVIDVYDNVPFLASAWAQIADPTWGFVSAYAKTNSIAGNGTNLPFSQGDFTGCSIDQNLIMDSFGDFYDNPGASRVSYVFNNSFGSSRPAGDFKWDNRFRIEQTSPTSPESSKINFYKLGGTCNASLWWAKKVLNPEPTLGTNGGVTDQAGGNNSTNNATTIPASTTLPGGGGNPRNDPNAPVMY